MHHLTLPPLLLVTDEEGCRISAMHTGTITIIGPHGNPDPSLQVVLNDEDALALAKFLLQHHGRPELAAQLP